MKKTYMNPEAETIEFDVIDVITTSGEADDNFGGENSNDDDGWTGWVE